MENELKLNNIEIKSNTLSKENLWVVIPVVLLVGLLSVLIYNHHAEFSWDGFVAGFNQEFFSVFCYWSFCSTS